MKINKWINGAIPALLLHLSVGSVYAFSLFVEPLVQYMGHSSSKIQFAFSLAIFFLGMSAAFCGKLVERNITKSAIIGTSCFISGLCLSALAVYYKSLIGLYIGYGVIGGIGLGVTYLTPCKTLMLHFKGNKGLAMGLSVMGFGFASTIASPIIIQLLNYINIYSVFLALALIYILPMCISIKLLKKPIEEAEYDKNNIVKFNYKQELFKDKFFIMSWLMFFINIHCGLALISSAASIMKVNNINIQMVTLIVSIMGVCNGLGRLVYSTISDYLSKRIYIYCIIFLLAILSILSIIYIPNTFIIGLVFCMIASLYGSGFSNIAPLLSDKYGMINISKIHGLILTAWGIAGLTGNSMTSLVYYMTNNYQYLYYILGVLYIIGFGCTLYLLYNVKRCGD